MTPGSPNPRHQPETEFTGELQVFSGPALSPDDPTLEPRERKGRPNDAGTLPACREAEPARTGITPLSQDTSWRRNRMSTAEAPWSRP